MDSQAGVFKPFKSRLSIYSMTTFHPFGNGSGTVCQLFHCHSSRYFFHVPGQFAPQIHLFPRLGMTEGNIAGMQRLPFY
jgi:hypothetical protein